MTERPPFAAPALMPRGMTIPEWRALVYAANTGWLGYVLPVSWMWITVLCAAFLIWMEINTSRVYDHGNMVAGPHPIHSTQLVWGLAWLTGFRVLLRTIDWVGKRKLARRIGLLPAAPGNP